MVVRARLRSFCFLTQHHHAQLAAQLAAQWPLHRFPGAKRRDEVLLAIGEHDRGWIPLDTEPCWNERHHAPYSFLDYPLMPRLRQYQRGIEEVAARSPYAGLLCSLHYGSLAHLAGTGAGREFLGTEGRRQRRLRQQLALTAPEEKAALNFHLQLLKFCDGLSLYLCLSDPGWARAGRHAAYRPDVPDLLLCHAAPGQPRLRAAWTDSETLRLEHSPFERPFTVAVQYTELLKADIDALGLAACHAHAPVRQQFIQVA